jgi:hypothetical protein
MFGKRTLLESSQAKGNPSVSSLSNMMPNRSIEPFFPGDDYLSNLIASKAAKQNVYDSLAALFMAGVAHPGTRRGAVGRVLACGDAGVIFESSAR